VARRYRPDAYGATASANLYSLVETAKANGLNEYAYLKHVFAMLPRADTVHAVEALLPWRVDRRVVQAELYPPDVENNVSAYLSAPTRSSIS
jgi:hypothetical protein